MTDEQLMLIAIEEAKLAEDHGDVPIGALVVLQGDIVSSRHNEVPVSGNIGTKMCCGLPTGIMSNV